MPSSKTIQEESVVLGLSLQDALGAAFAICVLIWAVERAYEWIIKPEREARSRRAEERREEMHREHWKELARKMLKK
ncbi:MAG: hypothetical protein ACRD8U_22235 [Pyrinomonadaceae bacterium]